MRMNFAEKMQTYRKQRGLSQEGLADLVGVSRQAVSKWESGQSYPEMDKMIALSELFHVSLDHLVKDAPDEAPAAEPAVRRVETGYRPYSYEFKSKRTWFGLPLVHINIGRGPRVAKGIVAIGNISVGAVSLGLVAMGGLCFGALALGLVSLAGLAAGLLLAAGGLAVGALAVGGAAAGLVAIGGVAIGLFSLGGCAIASHVAIGGYATGHIAIGDSVNGARTLLLENNEFRSIRVEQVKQLLDQEYPRLWKPLADRILALFS